MLGAVALYCIKESADMTCTFFGHRDAPSEVLPYLEKTISELIENENVDAFYVGNNGRFDENVIKALRKLKSKYPFIIYNIVLAYMPIENRAYNDYDYTETIYIEELTFVPKRFAISKRNEWMIKQSDFVVTYIRCSFGGANQFAEKAKRKKKQVINIYELMNEAVNHCNYQ